jgi:ABC-type lipopolysaccharide export system ATPase subunit
VAFEVYEDADKMQQLMDRQADLQDKIDALGAWEIDTKLEIAMDALRTPEGDTPIKNLSGGERRRTEIARALAVDPSFVLLDEPFAGVDPIAVEEIQSIVSKLKKKNIGILITDHNVDETLSITDRAYLLFEGKILKSGTPEELAADETVRRVYLGKHFELKRKV